MEIPRVNLDIGRLKRTIKQASKQVIIDGISFKHFVTPSKTAQKEIICFHPQTPKMLISVIIRIANNPWELDLT
jgi:alkyl sulfatase BDS1-like metallo-beta-lactamase superfamily hydrolase